MTLRYTILQQLINYILSPLNHELHGVNSIINTYKIPSILSYSEKKLSISVES